MASGSNRFIQYCKQTDPKVLPASPVFTRVRTTGGSGLVNNRTNVTSNEIRDDRQIIVSRLGNNQPDATIPFELSFDSYDDLMQGALGGSWIGGQNITANATLDTGGILTLSGGGDLWSNYPIAVGDFVLLNATGNSNVIAKVGVIATNTLTLEEVDETPLTTVAVAVAEDMTLITGHYAVATGTGVALADTIDIVAATKTVTQTTTGSTFADIGVELGDTIFFKGFSNGGNNGWHKVTAIDTTGKILTLGDSTALVNEAAVDATTISFVTSTGFLTVGKGLDAFALEEGFTDIVEGTDIDGNSITDGVFHNTLGATVSTFNMSIQPDAVITGEFAFQALTYSGFLNATVANSVELSNINDVFDSFTGTLTIPGVASCVVTGLDFTLDNGLNRRYAILQKDACSIGEGRSTVTGTLSAYFVNPVLSNIFELETALDINIRLQDLSGRGYVLGWPNVKLTSDSRDITENDVTSSIGFQALGGLSSDKKKTMYILRQPVYS